MQRVLGFVGLALWCGCGGGDASSPEISTREASAEECGVAGGTVLMVDQRDAATVCNGASGHDGAQGSQGARGEPGVPGTSGARGPAGANGVSAVSTAEIVAGVAAKASAIVIVECTDGVSGGDGSGTKTFTGTVITAMHVVDGMTSCSVYSESPVTLLGNVTSFTQVGGRDESELEVAWTADALTIAGVTPLLGAVPAVGDLITVVGNPGLYDGLSLEHQYTTGYVTATSLQGTFASVPSLAGRDSLWARAWSTDAVAWHGNSGGPVFDARGNWIGILVGGFNGNPENAGPDLSVVLPLF